MKPILSIMTGSYASLADVRRLSGGIGSISDPDMQDFLNYGNIAIEACTGLKDIDPSDTRYPLFESGAEYFASSLVRHHFADKADMSQKHYDRARQICLDIMNLGSSGSSSARAVSQGYETYPLNPDGKYFSNRYIDRNGGTSVFEEDEIS